jgi:riboflavin transporter FmnP
MKTRAIAITIAFSALTIVLNPAVSGIAVPAPYLPSRLYEIWEIPIVAAILLLGSASGVSVALLNAAFLLALFPGPVRPFYPVLNLAACLSMLLGIYLAQKLIMRGVTKEKVLVGNKSVIYFTILGILFRTAIMTIVWYALLTYTVVSSLFSWVVITTLSLIAFYNVTLPLYTIPVGYFLAKTVEKNLKVGKIWNPT